MSTEDQGQAAASPGPPDAVTAPSWLGRWMLGVAGAFWFLLHHLRVSEVEPPASPVFRPSSADEGNDNQEI